MSNEQYTSPPCFMHELDPDFVEIEMQERPKKTKRPERPIKDETDEP